MVKKKEYSAQNWADETEQGIAIENRKQKALEAKQKQEGGGVLNPKGKGTRWRLDQRPNAKNIHFDDTLNKRINLLSQLENKPIEDILYDIIAEWFNDHFDDRKKELLGEI